MILIKNMRVGVNMLKLEEYIEKRKLEDGINEFDNSQKMNNIRSCRVILNYSRSSEKNYSRR